MPLEGTKETPKQPKVGNAAGQKRVRASQQGGSKEGRSTLKPPKPAVKSPVAKSLNAASSGVKKTKMGDQPPSASPKASGDACYQHLRCNA